MGERARSFGVRVVLGVVVLAGATACGGSTPAQAPASTAATTTTAAATTEASATTEAAAARPLARVFPDVDASTCVPSGSDVRTGTGAVPTEAYTCDYSATAAGSTVIFAEWPDQAAAQAWYQDTVNLGPRIEDFQTWSVSDGEQGPRYTATNANNVTISTGVYQSLPYTWEIRAGSLDDVNTIGQQLQLQPSSAIGS